MPHYAFLGYGNDANQDGSKSMLPNWVHEGGHTHGGGSPPTATGAAIAATGGPPLDAAAACAAARAGLRLAIMSAMNSFMHLQAGKACKGRWRDSVPSLCRYCP